MKALDWLIAWLTPRIKVVRGKDMAPFRALAALLVSFVKPGSKHHAALLGCGWAALEVAYANMMAVLSQSVKDALRLDSLVTEKIVVNLFQEAFSCEAALPAAVYEQLSVLFVRSQKFRIKCNGCESLLEVLNDSRIQNSDRISISGLKIFPNFLRVRWKWAVKKTDSLQFSGIWACRFFTVSRHCCKMVSQLVVFTRDTSMSKNWMPVGMRSITSR